MGREAMSLAAPREDALLSYGESEFQFGHLRLPRSPGPHPVAMVIHGGFWRAARGLEYAGNLAAALSAMGLATWNIEYRRVGQPGGGYPGALDDVAQASAFLSAMAGEYALDLGRVIVLGHSAGGQLALWLASSGRGVPLRGAVSLAGAVDLRRAWELNLGDGAAGGFLGGGPHEVPGRYRDASPIERLPVGVPVRLIHGERDDVVPIEQSERYAEASRAAGSDCRLTRLDCDHFDIVDVRTEAWGAVADVVLELAALR